VDLSERSQLTGQNRTVMIGYLVEMYTLFFVSVSQGYSVHLCLFIVYCLFVHVCNDSNRAMFCLYRQYSSYFASVLSQFVLFIIPIDPRIAHFINILLTCVTCDGPQ
jgi:hypothetical protein